MFKLVLIRHGESTSNLDKKLTGWLDVDLTAKGVKQAKKAGKLLREKDYTFDVAHCSYLKRAIRTLWCTLDEMGLMWLPVHYDWKLNERHFGAFQGLKFREVKERFGEKMWLDSWELDFHPPQATDQDNYYGSWCHAIDPRIMPRTESLKETNARFLDYWNNAIVPDIKSDKKVLIVAHGALLRLLIVELEHLHVNGIGDMPVPHSALPLIYELDDNLEVCDKYYVAEPEDKTPRII